MNDPLTPPPTAVNPTSPPPTSTLVNNHRAVAEHPEQTHPRPSSDVKSEGDMEDDEELLLKWDDHHRSFFDLAENLCHQEQFIDVTLSCGDHTFPAHKLILSVCSPYFRHLFLRNPCKHPIVVLKDVPSRYMKLLLMYMYRGEVSCPQEDLAGLLRTARSLQIRGLVELERKREAEGLGPNHVTSPVKKTPSEIVDGGSTTSMESQEFSLDEVRSRLHGTLEIQPISQPSSSTYSHQSYNSALEMVKAAATSSSSEYMAQPGNGSGEEDERLPHHYQKLRKLDTSSVGHRNKWGQDNGSANNHPSSNNGGTDLSIHHRRSPFTSGTPSGRSETPRGRTSRSNSASTVSQAHAQLLAAASAAGMPASSLDPSDPMSSMNALLAAAQAHSGASANNHPVSTLASLLPAASSTSASSPASSAANSTPPAAPGAAPSSSVSAGNGGAASAANSSAGTNGQGVDLSQAAAVANLQLYYYMQKVASAGMGNPKERKECPICGKTLYDRSTWNRHMRIHTGEKPYPCRFCGRRFRTNYNKLGHEKKCPDRQVRPMSTSDSPSGVNNNPAPSTTPTPAQSNGPTSRESAVYR